MYNCGPTVYDYAHVGNFRTFIVADILRRALELNGYRVKQVMNITDVGHLVSDADTGDDKMERSASREQVSIWDIAKKYTDNFIRNSKALGLKEPSMRPRATDHIQEQIDLVRELERKGFTYATADGIYFDTLKDPNYGRLAGQALQEKLAGARVAVIEGKRNPSDFALWKFSPSGSKRQMEWDSPWKSTRKSTSGDAGKGFPGWHIECSAMSEKYLGVPFDIHTGGIDHIPVHHTNEIAQTENARGVSMAHYWLHSEFLTMDGDKMAKSQGNFVRIEDVEAKGYSPLAYRLLVLQSHYRSQMHFSWDAIKKAQDTLDGMHEFLFRLRAMCVKGGALSGTLVAETEAAKRSFMQQVNDDLNTPEGVAVVFGYIRLINGYIDRGSLACDDASMVREAMEWFNRVLGLFPKRGGAGAARAPHGAIPKRIREAAHKREQLRYNKQFDAADAIRREVLAEGFEIRDTQFGSVIKKI